MSNNLGFCICFAIWFAIWFVIGIIALDVEVCERVR